MVQPALTHLPPKKPRDVRLDFFRGLTMMVIFIAHVYNNPWDRYIPARFGFSSGAELFVFCSGFASALAFGSVFERRGFFMGCARIIQRIFQIYGVHLGLFLTLWTIDVLAMNAHLGDGAYEHRIGFDVVLNAPRRWLPGIMGLYYVPDFLNILPMYMVLLALVPVMVLLSKFYRGLAGAFSIGLWLMVQLWHLNLSAGPEPDWLWFFNPFAWQLMFFTGFGFGMGWLSKPSFANRPLFAFCCALLIVSVPVNFWAFTENVPALDALGKFLAPGKATTELALARYAHFLAFAYVVLALVDKRQALLFSPALAWVVQIGRASLPCFFMGLALSWSFSIALDVVGRTALPVFSINVLGIAGLYLTARVVGWYRRTPWVEDKARLASHRHELPEASVDSMAAAQAQIEKAA